MITKSTDARSREKSARLAIENLAVPEYTIFSRKWELCDDVFDGEMKVKAKAEDNGYVYRPESKKGAKRQKAWEAYLGRGTLPDFATKTLGQMVGTLASVPPEITFDGKAARLDYLRDYCTPYRDGLEALFHRVTEYVIRHGRYCLLLEPDEDGDKFHVNEYKARKYLRCKIAETSGGGETYASLILLDTSCISYDTRRWRDVYYPQITLLGLDGAGRYYQAVFGKNDRGAAISNYSKSGQMVFDDSEEYAEAMGEVFGKLETFDVLNPDPARCTQLEYPQKYGRFLDRIPFVCINPLDLSLTSFQNPPLFDVCTNCLHILNADCTYQTSLFMTGDPQPVIYGAAKSDMKVGSDSMWFLPQGASFQFESVSGAGLSEQAANLQRMKEETRQMGLSLTGAEGIANTPVGTMNLYRNAQTAGLVAINRTCGNGVEQVLRYAGKWLGMKDEELAENIKFRPSDKFAEIDATVQECLALAASDKIPMTQEEKRKYIEQNGLVSPRPWDEVESELEREKEERRDNGLDSVSRAFGFREKGEEEQEQGKEEETEEGNPSESAAEEQPEGKKKA